MPQLVLAKLVDPNKKNNDNKGTLSWQIFSYWNISWLNWLHPNFPMISWFCDQHRQSLIETTASMAIQWNNKIGNSFYSNLAKKADIANNTENNRGKAMKMKWMQSTARQDQTGQYSKIQNNENVSLRHNIFIVQRKGEKTLTI